MSLPSSNIQELQKQIQEKSDQLKTIQEKCELQNKKIKLLRKQNDELKTTIERQNQTDTNLLLSSKELSNNNTKLQASIKQLKQQILSQGEQTTLSKAKNKVNVITLQNIIVNESTVQIDLPNQMLNDQEVLKLQPFSQLKVLLLNDNQLSNESILMICKNLVNMEKLNIANNKFQAESLKEIANLKNLKFLDIRNNLLGDECLEYIAKNSNLQQLSACKNNITDKGVQFIQTLINLVYVDFTNNQITDEGAKSILKFTKLTHLYLMSNKLTKLGVGWLMKDMKCQVFDVRFNAIQNQDKEQLKASKQQHMHFFC